MKKLFVLLGVAMLSVMSNAQGLGNYMEIDGVPGFVFHIDESGEHGLVMSFRQMSAKQVGKYVKKGLLTKEKAEKLYAKENKSKISKKERENIYKGVMESLSDDGEQNQIAIVDYCKEKDMALSTFPMQEWAASLGDGWFIPGDRELTLFAEFYTGGLGKSYGLSTANFCNNRWKELSNDPIVQQEIMMICFYGGFYSSTIKHADCGFRSLRRQSSSAMALKSKIWFEIFDSIQGQANICAVHKF